MNSDEAVEHFAALVAEVLNTQASPNDHARLTEHLIAVRNNDSAQQVTDRIASETPFAGVANKIHEVNHKHPPGWGAWLAGLLIPIVLSLAGLFAQGTPQALPPEPPTPADEVRATSGTSPMTEAAPIQLYDAGEASVSVTYGTAQTGQSVTIIGPRPDVEEISNILRQYSPTEFGSLSQEQQNNLAHRVFAELQQQSDSPTAARTFWAGTQS